MLRNYLDTTVIRRQILILHCAFQYPTDAAAEALQKSDRRARQGWRQDANHR